MIYKTKNDRETRQLAKDLANLVKEKKSRGARVLALNGDLGSGKTTFTQALARSLGVKEKIKSPTFVLMKAYQAKGLRFFHIDTYRLKDEEDLKVLGFEEIIKNQDNIVVIEWADKILRVLPSDRIVINFKHISEGEREIEVLGLL